MKIIRNNEIIDTEKELVVFAFDNEDEFNQFMTKLAQSEVRTSGMRLIPVYNENVELTPKFKFGVQLLEALDGIGGKEHKDICDNAVDMLNSVLKKGAWPD